MSYWALNAVFLAAVAVIGCLALVAGRRRGGLRWASIALAGALLLVTTAIFDNLMIGVGLVGYDASKISGAFLGIAPLEDFAYPVAAVLLLPSLWVLLGGRRDERR
ncbi:lycopene cyclase domain-containing protein [Lacisediminihabitans sp.]|jgi:lycopene cyclase domain-containing protein|uniref:lycopene cyclase domain-containing protein n=1 Tax=Lacisediminihabitans sp. TaxID=2787631 RepID=UPI002F95A219